MNTDDLESRLESRRLREVPEEWRSEILRAARAAQESQDRRTTRPSLIETLRQHIAAVFAFAPGAKAWAGLAAVWVGILALNLSTREPANTLVQSERPAAEMILALKEQAQFRRELLGEPEPVAPDRPAPFAPRRRSESNSQLPFA